VGRLVILLLIIVTIVVLWKAFGPGSGVRRSSDRGSGQWSGLRGRGQKQVDSTPAGPDDDPDFLWNIRKERFKQRREAEREEELRIQHARRRQELEDKAREENAQNNQKPKDETQQDPKDQRPDNGANSEDEN